MEKPIEVSTSDEESPLEERSLSRLVVDIGALARIKLAKEPGLFAVGVAGIVIAILCLAAVATRGSFIPPEGRMLDAVTFTFGVGLFTLTIALLLPLAGYSTKAHRRWRRAYYVFSVYGLTLESIQAFRGLDPRFSEVGGQLDEIAGIVFGLTAGLNTILFLLLGLRFFQTDTLRDRPILRLGIRYGAAAVALSFGVGIMMSVLSGREIGDAGNLLLAHALGVHGIQFVPLVALMMAWAGAAPSAPAWLHAAGIGWLVACTAALAQALLGRPPLEGSILTTLMVGGLLVWACAVGNSLLLTKWSRPSSQRDPSSSASSRSRR